jgi:hypothetical protein
LFCRGHKQERVDSGCSRANVQARLLRETDRLKVIGGRQQWQQVALDPFHVKVSIRDGRTQMVQREMIQRQSEVYVQEDFGERNTKVLCHVGAKTSAGFDLCLMDNLPSPTEIWKTTRQFLEIGCDQRLERYILSFVPFSFRVATIISVHTQQLPVYMPLLLCGTV